MRSALVGVLSVAALVAMLASHPGASAATSTHPAHHSPSPAPPVIYHESVRPLCAALVHHVAPVIAMMTQNDQTIARSPSLFERYGRDLDTATHQGDQTDQADIDMTLQHLSQLVGPLATNVNAIERELENTQVFPPNPQTPEEKMLDQMRDELLKSLAVQAVSLDIINGYVQTRQLAEMQHEGLQGSEINAIQNADTTAQMSGAPPSPDPMLQGNDQAGLQQNPYTFDPLAVPGITGSVGSTPLTRLIAALHWLQQETTRRENVASTTIIRAAGVCRRAASSPSP